MSDTTAQERDHFLKLLIEQKEMEARALKRK